MELVEFNVFLMFRLVAAVLLGGLIGLERSGNHHNAGLRTHILVCLGAASIMVVSECIVERYQTQQELMRMGAQVISGIGFLGAGNIIADGNKIRGITTAAGIWTTACVGIIVGSGYYAIACTVVVFMLFAMLVLRSAKAHVQARDRQYVLKAVLDSREAVKPFVEELHARGVEIVKLQLQPNGAGGNLDAMAELRLLHWDKKRDFISEMGALPGVTELVPLS